MVRQALPVVALLLCSMATPKAASLTRADVVSLYREVWQPAGFVDHGWTGNRTHCVAGGLAPAFVAAMLDRINTYRWLAGLPPVSAFDDLRAAQTRAAALLMSSNHQVNHAPPPHWTCWSAGAATGAANSNLALGYAGVDAIDAYMDDAGPENASVGHRRWLLFPPQLEVGVGYVPGDAAHFPAQALWVLGPFGPRPATPQGVAWPPPGYVPFGLMPKFSNRWSFSHPDADFSTAVVTMRCDDELLPAPIQMTPLAGQGDPTLVWLASGVDYGRPARDLRFTVRIEGIAGPGVPAEVEYDVIVIDPDAPEQCIFGAGFESAQALSACP